MEIIRHLAVRLGLVLLVLAVCGCGQNEVAYDLAGGSASSWAVSADTNEAKESETGGAGQTARDPKDQGNAARKAPDAEDPVVIYVYVCGAVASPGVYSLPEGSRVYELIESAGGLSEEADEKSLNQARVLSDGEQVTVCAVGETALTPGAEREPPGESFSGGTGKINLNTADASMLQALSGIGQARAQAIIAYREEHGGFQHIEEIMEIEGIKEKLFEKIKEQIEV